MRINRLLPLLVTVLVLSGCGAEEAPRDQARALKGSANPVSAPTTAANTTALPAQSAPAEATKPRASSTQALQVSLTEASNEQVASEAASRKIIRNAELQIEIDVPTEGLNKITSIAESLGGFVVTSELKQSDSNQQKPTQSVSVIARVPSAQFNTAMERVRSLGNRVVHEKVSGQDVSEEYLDLEARIRTKKALEAQFLEIMKQAKSVSDALEVQSQLADVRTEIERLEGRHRFLDNQSALSTITITMQPPAPAIAVTTEGFGDNVRRSLGNSIEIAVSIVLGLVRFIIVLAPIVVLFGVPGWFLWRILRRKITLPKRAGPVPDAQQ
jgi:Domain of unknown function (DUF4349)